MKTKQEIFLICILKLILLIFSQFEDHEEDILHHNVQTDMEDDSFENESFSVNGHDDDLTLEYGFGNLHPKYIEYTNIFPEFPKTAIKGFVTVLQIPESILHNEQKVKELKKTMQYTLTNVGVGFRTKKNIPFFNQQHGGDSENEENGIEIQYGRRRCAGVKVCEFFPNE